MSEVASSSAPRTRRLPIFLLPIVFALGLLSLAAAILAPIPRSSQPPSTTNPDSSATTTPAVPEFRLMERSGQMLSRDDLLGKVWVASFVFTHCTGPCPSVTGTMARLQADLKLAERPNLRLVTFTVDPDRDDPAALKKYAENFRADPTHWLFLTGEEEQIHKLLHDGFGIHAARSANPTPPAGQEFDHSTRLALVDKNGHIRGYYDGFTGEHDADGANFRASYDRLVAAVDALLQE
ncbi:MAG: SCO family protein [Bacteroidales bacterium]|nr:SCO family protein [Bacteroidales bacterium]